MKYAFILNTQIPQSDRPWAYEALFHCYLPLFKEIREYPITMGLSPQLIYEFTGKDFKERVKAFYESTVKKVKKITDKPLRKYYIDFYEEQYSQLESCQFNLSDLRKIIG